MTLQVVRDIAITAYCIVAIGALVFISILAFSVYSRLRQLLDSSLGTVKAVERFVNFIADADAITRIAAVIQGVRQGLGSAAQFFKGGEKK